MNNRDRSTLSALSTPDIILFSRLSVIDAASFSLMGFLELSLSVLICASCFCRLATWRNWVLEAWNKAMPTGTRMLIIQKMTVQGKYAPKGYAQILIAP